MAIQFQNRRGTVSENNNFTGAAGELSVDTTNNKLRLHDGATLGGFTVGSYDADVRDYGAVGDGITDDTAAIQAAVNANNIIFLPDLPFLITSPITVGGGKAIIGKGKNTWSPYIGTGSGFPNHRKTAIIVNANGAFDCSGSHNVFIAGLSIEDTNGTQSNYGTAAGYITGSFGIRIEDTTSVTMDEVSFHGLEYGVVASETVDAGEAQMFKLSNFLASDCKVVVRMGNTGTSAYIARDFHITDCVIALHCNTFIEVYNTDGIQLNNLRFFQAFSSSVIIKRSPFVSGSNITLFETNANSMVVESCSYVDLSATTITRSGGYSTTTPWVARVGLVLLDCNDVKFDGIIERPGGIAIDIDGCDSVTINGSIRQPYYTSGMMVTTGPGGIDVATSTNININCSFGQDNAYYFSVASDYASSREISGSISSPGFTNVKRAYQLTEGNEYNFNYVFPADQALNTLSSAVKGYMNVYVPDGKKLVSRSWSIGNKDAILRVGALFWTTGLITDENMVHSSYENKTLYSNSTGAAVEYQVAVSAYNPTGGIITVKGGARFNVSLALENV